MTDAQRILDATVALTDRNTLRDGILELLQLMADDDIQLTGRVRAQLAALVAFAKAMKEEKADG